MFSCGECQGVDRVTLVFKLDLVPLKVTLCSFLVKSDLFTLFTIALKWFQPIASFCIKI